MGFRSCNGVALSEHFFAGYTVVSGARPKCWQRQCRVRQVWFMTRKPVFSVKSVASNIIAAGLCFFLTLFLGVKNSLPSVVPRLTTFQGQSVSWQIWRHWQWKTLLSVEQLDCTLIFLLVQNSDAVLARLAGNGDPVRQGTSKVCGQQDETIVALCTDSIFEGTALIW